MVFTAHYLRLPQALYWGRAGVDAFFVLSGFLITGILFDSASRPNRFRIFYTRRALRIFPLYYLVLLLPLLLHPLFGWRLHEAHWLWPAYLGNYMPIIWPAGAHESAGNLTILRSTKPAFQNLSWNLDHLWSLCVEEQFYLIWPPIVFLIKDRRRLLLLCAGAVCLAPLARWACILWAPAARVDNGLLYLAAPLRADALLLGGALALAWRGPEGARLQRAAVPLTCVLAGAFLLWQLLSLVQTGHAIDPIWSSLHNPLYASFNAAASLALLLFVLSPGGRLRAQLSGPRLRWLGQRSYGLYVYHVLLFSQFAALARLLCGGHSGAGAAILPAVALLCTIGIAALSYRFFETPWLRLKPRLV